MKSRWYVAITCIMGLIFLAFIGVSIISINPEQGFQLSTGVLLVFCAAAVIARITTPIIMASREIACPPATAIGGTFVRASN